MTSKGEKAVTPKDGTDSALVDPNAKNLLETAAAAVNMSVERLVNLAHDHGAVVAPPSDGITKRYTLEDLGVQLWTQRTKVPPREWPKWFEGLVETQQIALIVMLRSKGFSSVVIGSDYGVNALEVQKIYNRYADSLGDQVVNVRLTTIAGQLQLAAERACDGAKDKEDWATYWRVHKEMVGLMQSMGIVDKAIHKIEVTHNFDDQSKREISIMLDIERKRRERLEELEMAETTVVDDLPEELDDESEAKHTMLKPYRGT